MSRIAATGFVALSLVCSSSAAAQSDPPSSPGTAAQVSDAEAMRAVERARAALAVQLDAAPSDFKVARVERVQWNDSSLGCRQPGSTYLQVISEGHAVVLERAEQAHRVHVSGSIVAICDPRTRGGGSRMPTRAQGLIDAGARARNDLAQRLRLDPKDVRVVKMEPQRWADGNLGCSNARKAEGGAVSGYKLQLNASGRVYTYHTDLKNVLACPPIEEH
jgi:hypothetical protein